MSQGPQAGHRAVGRTGSQEGGDWVGGCDKMCPPKRPFLLPPGCFQMTPLWLLPRTCLGTARICLGTAPQRTAVQPMGACGGQ